MKIRDILKAKGSQVYSVAPHRTVKGIVDMNALRRRSPRPCAPVTLT